MTVEQRVVIVTGAGGNLGAAVAAEMNRQGASLVCVDYAAASLEALEKSLSPASGLLALSGLDLTRHEDAQKMVAATLDKFGRVDALVNTVGGFRMAPVVDALDDWDFLMNINARAALATSAAVAPVMKQRGFGRIVHIAAGAGNKGGAEMSVYSAAKAAVMRITESLAEELSADGVTVNCILPGTIDTPQNRAAMPDADTSRWVPPSDIAKVIAFLISDMAGAVTGAAIPVTRRS
ncbi:MAG: SDR family oxidoreductase [Rhodoblastus sp.]|nr:SDR family oxidoreductase [Rhodoblastus sp.]MCB9998655.1 SDR family oxidoreductase [Methylobacteriaceae bacterium]